MSDEISNPYPSTGRWTAAEGQAAVAAWQLSGLSRAAWCRAHHVAPHRLTYWIGVAIPAPISESLAMSHFTEVRRAAPSTTDALTVVCASGARVVVQPGIDVAFVRSVVEALS